MFGEVISEVVGAFAPVDEKLSLGDTVADPIKTHIHCFGSTLFDGVVADAGGAGVVRLDGSSGLRVAHVGEGGAEHGGFLTVLEERTEFSFGGGGEDGGHDGGVDVDGTVGRWRSGGGRGSSIGIS